MGSGGFRSFSGLRLPKSCEVLVEQRQRIEALKLDARAQDTLVRFMEIGGSRLQNYALLRRPWLVDRRNPFQSFQKLRPVQMSSRFGSESMIPLLPRTEPSIRVFSS